MLRLPPRRDLRLRSKAPPLIYVIPARKLSKNSRNSGLKSSRVATHASATARLLAHVVSRRLDRLLEALRYAYRLGAEAKLQHLARAG